MSKAVIIGGAVRPCRALSPAGSPCSGIGSTRAVYAAPHVRCLMQDERESTGESESSDKPLQRRRRWDPLLALLASGLLWTLHKTYRIRVQGEVPQERPLLFAFWHGEQQLILPHRPIERLTVLTSLSADGQLQARILSRLGIRCISGSSSRGGIAGLRRLIRAVKNDGACVALAVDGPRGPRCEAKAGIVQLSRATGVPIIPIRAQASRAWCFSKSWDHFTLPKPFAQITLQFLPPVATPRRAGRGEIDALAATLSEKMNAAAPFGRGG